MTTADQLSESDLRLWREAVAGVEANAARQQQIAQLQADILKSNGAYEMVSRHLAAAYDLAPNDEVALDGVIKRSRTE